MRWHSASIKLPNSVAGEDVLHVKEAVGTVWAWAFPKVLLWPADVRWIFSPINSRNHWPGDLWGVDSDGELIIAENKCHHGGSGCDPLQDFVAPGVRSDETTAGSLQLRWEYLLAKELRAPGPNQPPLSGPMPGILPASSRRRALYEWSCLYDSLFNAVRSSEYQQAVRRSLNRRERAGNPPPHFVALVTVTHPGEPRLSTAGHDNHRALVRRVGKDHVHMRAIRGTAKLRHGVVNAWSFEP